MIVFRRSIASCEWPANMMMLSLAVLLCLSHVGCSDAERDVGVGGETERADRNGVLESIWKGSGEFKPADLLDENKPQSGRWLLTALLYMEYAETDSTGIYSVTVSGAIEKEFAVKAVIHSPPQKELLRARYSLLLDGNSPVYRVPGFAEGEDAETVFGFLEHQLHNRVEAYVSYHYGDVLDAGSP